MKNQKIIDMLNEQLNKELFSAYFYTAMEAYFASQNLDGFAHFFMVQTKEELDHARLIFDYINKIGGRVILKELKQPKIDYTSPTEVFELALAHEQFITSSIHEIAKTALEEKDLTTHSFLQWFINEQAEEEETMDKILRKLKFIKEDPSGLLFLDKELSTRVYTPPSIMQAE
ncbi:ferritin [Caldicellulosiruptor changbaiensis]|uniref:Ferritin n=1 Tax=Caldicellulosiruptor changbaiensis TaxID=1222016 RepID=A0A3T0D4C6_9FIRM|nr:ferritin [Caldicellulosiruptor changbaiensis]AZT89897.1 ferritin [Caldicellulosiruptor changbaiensis]